MTTDNNGVEPTPEISEMISDLIDNADALSLSDDNIPEEPDEHYRVCYSCQIAINTETDSYYEGALWRSRYNYRPSNVSPYEDHIYCDECYFYCEDCDEAALTEYSNTIELQSTLGRGSYLRTVCNYCSDNYRDCDRCDDRYHCEDLIFVDEGESDSWDNCQLCPDCHNTAMQETTRVLHDYSWQPPERNFWYVDDKGVADSPNSFMFKGVHAIPNLDGWHGYDSSYEQVELNKRKLFMGFELETNNRSCGSLTEAGKFLLQSVGGDDFEGEKYLYIKQDGSISGFEIVSMPATLEAHKVLLPRDAIRALASEHGLAGWREVRGNGAGLHVHVSKASFAHSHLHKFQMFHYRNQEWLKRFAGRDSSRWSSFERTSNSYGDEYKLSDFAKGTYNNRHLNRYHALNFVPYNTVELRYFRSTLNPDSLLGTLELIHAIWRYTLINRSRDIHDDKFSWGTFRSWVADQPDYEYAIPTMTARTV